MSDVIFNLLATLRPKTGIGHYADQLFRAMRAQRCPYRIDGFPGPAVRDFASAWFANGAKKPMPAGGSPSALSKLKNVATDGARRLGRWGLERAFRVASRGYGIYHEPNMVPFPHDGRTIVTLHDLSVLLYPQWHPSHRVEFYERCFERGLRAGHDYIAPTECIRQELIRHLGLPPTKVTTVHNGLSNDFRTVDPLLIADLRKRYELPGSFLLYVGTIEPRKNLKMLMEAYVGLPDATREQCPLVLVGGWGWRSEDVAEYYHSTARHRGVRHLGYVGADELPAFFHAARALVYPSHYEGFGLPPIEMLAAGGAVIASTAAALQEVLRPAGHFVDPLDTDGWRTAMAKAIADDAWCADLRKPAKAVASRYSWERCARETLAVYGGTALRTQAA